MVDLENDSVLCVCAGTHFEVFSVAPSRCALDGDAYRRFGKWNCQTFVEGVSPLWEACEDETSPIVAVGCSNTQVQFCDLSHLDVEKFVVAKLRHAGVPNVKRTAAVGPLSLASGDSDGEVIFWRIDQDCYNDSEPVGRISTSPQRSSSIGEMLGNIAELPNQFITTSWDCTVRIWDIATLKEIGLFDRHEKWVSGVAWSRDRRLLITGSDDRRVICWDVRSASSGDPVAIFENVIDERLFSLMLPTKRQHIETDCVVVGGEKSVCLLDLRRIDESQRKSQNCVARFESGGLFHYGLVEIDSHRFASTSYRRDSPKCVIWRYEDGLKLKEWRLERSGKQMCYLSRMDEDEGLREMEEEEERVAFVLGSGEEMFVVLVFVHGLAERGGRHYKVPRSLLPDEMEITE